MSYASLIWAGLWRRPVRTLLTFLSITVAFLLFGLLHGLNQGMSAVVRDFRDDRLYVMNQISMYHPVLLTYAFRIEDQPEVERVAYWAYFVGYYQDPTQLLPIVAADVQKLFAVYPELRIKPGVLAEMARTKTGAIVSKPLADRYGWKTGDRIPVKTLIWNKKDGTSDWYFDLVGTYEPAAAAPTFSDLFFINLDHFDEARAFGQGAVHLLVVQLRKPDTDGKVARKIDAMFESSPFKTRTRSERAYAQVQWRQISDLSLIANAIVGAVLVTLLVVAASTMIQSVRERNSEWAVLKTLGFTGERILVLVCAEALLLCVSAAVLGLGLSVLLFPLVGDLFGGIHLPASVLMRGLGVAAIVGLLSAFIPAWRARQLDIAPALVERQE